MLHPSAAQVTEPAVPLFRARMIGLGFEPDRKLVLLELRERADDEDDEDDETGVPPDDEPPRGGLRRPHLRHAGTGPGDGDAGCGSGDPGAAALPALQLPDGPRRSHLPSVELNPPGGTGPARRI